MLFQKKNPKIFEVSINPTLTKKEIQKELEVLSKTTEIVEVVNENLDIISVTRGSSGGNRLSQIIYEIYFRDNKLENIIKSQRESIFEGVIN